jgi:hypothetical protein
VRRQGALPGFPLPGDEARKPVERRVQLRAPGMGAVEAQAVVVLALAGEEGPGGDGDPLFDGAGIERPAIEAGVKFEPESSPRRGEMRASGKRRIRAARICCWRWAKVWRRRRKWASTPPWRSMSASAS